MTEYVVDASAIVALARGETGFERVESARERGVVSAVNWMEAFSRLVRHDLDPERVQSFLRIAFPTVVAFDRDQAETAAMIHAGTRDKGLSLGDCACLALSSVRNATALTADRAWTTLSLNVRVESIR